MGGLRVEASRTRIGRCFPRHAWRAGQRVFVLIAARDTAADARLPATGREGRGQHDRLCQPARRRCSHRPTL